MNAHTHALAAVEDFLESFKYVVPTTLDLIPMLLGKDGCLLYL